MDKFHKALELQMREVMERVGRATDAARASPKGRAELSAHDLAAAWQAMANLAELTSGFQPAPDGKPYALLRVRRKDVAAAHVLAARAKIIDDPSPNKTAREAFGVTQQAVQGWVKREQANPGWATALVGKARALLTQNPEGAKALVDIRIEIARQERLADARESR